jgi:hypothetical protein
LDLESRFVYERDGVGVAAETLDQLFAEAFAHFSAAVAEVNADSSTAPDPETGEQWDLAHLLGHVSEMLEYWLVEVLRVLAHGPDEPFGRLKRSPERLVRIDRSSQLAIAELRQEINLRAAASIDLCRILTPAQLKKRGDHPKFGSMTVEAIITEFGIEHLSEHAAQLQSLR